MVWKVIIIVLVVLLALLAFLYFYGNKLQARQAEQQAMMEQMKQTVSILPIDKKKMKLKEAFMDEIEERYQKEIAPQEEKLDIPSFEGDSIKDIEDGYPF